MLIDKKLVMEAKNLLGEKAAFIIAKDLQLKEWDEQNLKSLCPQHSEETGSFIWDSKTNANFFKCFGCGITLNIIDHYISFYKLTYLQAVEKLFNEVGIKHSFAEKGLKANRDYNYPHYEISDDRTKVEEYCLLRKISKETLDRCDVQQSTSGLLMWNFYDENDVLLTVKCRNPRKIKKGEQKEWYLPGFDYTPILYNMNKVDTSQKTLVITEGQIDCLSVIESNYTNCVSVPGGTENMNWIPTCFDWLEQFEKIIIFADNDLAGIKMRKEVISRLGSWRTLYVDVPQEMELPDGKKVRVKDANEVLYYFGPQKILDFISNAQEMPVSGVSNLAEIADFDLESASGLYTHINDIDKIIYKFLFGSVVLVTGVKGSGKTSLINQCFVCESLDQGNDVFLFSGELAEPVLKSWIELSMAGSSKIKMKNDFIHIIDPIARKEMISWYNGHIWIYTDVSNKSEDILDKAVTVIRKYGIRTLVLDNLMTIDIGASEGDILQKQKEFIVRLVGLAKLYNVLIILVCHPRKIQAGMQVISDDISGSGDLGNLAQYIMSVHRYSQKERAGEKDGRGNYRKGKEPIDYDVCVSILKNRFTGKIGDCQLYFDYPSYRFYKTSNELYKRFGWDKDTTPIPKSLPNKSSDVPSWASGD